MPMWLGNPGRVVQLPYPDKGYTVTGEIASTLIRTLGGGQIVSRAPGPGRRTYNLSWSWIDPDSFSIIEEFFTGARGPGPHALIDPGRRNRLTANQASATVVTGDTSQFICDPSELLSSTVDTYQRGPRALKWSLPAVVTSGVLEYDVPGLVGVPLPPNQPWTFSGAVSLGGIVPSLAVTPTLSWRDINGAEVSTTAGTPVTAVPGSWASFSVTVASPPGGVVALRAQLRVTPGVITTATGGNDTVDYRPPAEPERGNRVQVVDTTASPPAYVIMNPRRPIQSFAYVDRGAVNAADILVDASMLDMFNGVRAWVVGTGIPRVSVVSLPETDRTLPFRDASATFVEVG